MVVFVCKNPDTGHWVLNKFKAFAGQFLSDETNRAKLENIKEEYAELNVDSSQFGKCYKRQVLFGNDDEIVNFIENGVRGDTQNNRQQSTLLLEKFFNNDLFPLSRT